MRLMSRVNGWGSPGAVGSCCTYTSDGVVLSRLIGLGAVGSTALLMLANVVGVGSGRRSEAVRFTSVGCSSTVHFVANVSDASDL